MAIDKRKRPSRALRADANARVAAAASAAAHSARRTATVARAPGALATPVEHVSKSAMRRRRRRAREELGSRGMEGLSDAVEDVADALPTEEAPAVNTHAPTGQKAARATLERERQRQPQIIAQLARTENPFAALRTHARHTLGLSGTSEGT